MILDKCSEYGEEMAQELDLLKQAKITISRRKSRGIRLSKKNRRQSGLNEDLGTVIEEDSIPESELNSALKYRDPRSVYTQRDCEQYLMTKILD